MGQPMIFDERASNLMFLLSLPLAVGCAGGSDDDTTTGPVVDPSTTGADDDPGTTTSTGPVGGDTSTTRGGDPGTTTDEPPPADSTTSEYGTTGEYNCEGMGPMTGPISQACMDFVAKYNECYYEGMQTPECITVMEAYCQSYLEYSTMAYGEACGMANEELYVCLSQLSCELLTDKMEDCTEQSMAAQVACMGM